MAKTLIERFGFSDHELGTKKHDAICLWLDGKLRSNTFFSQPLISAHEMEWELRNAKISPEEAGYLPVMPYASLARIEWEVPIRKGTFTVGFIDIKATMRWPGISLQNREKKWKLSWGDRKFLFEIKPSIPSVGELLRQLQFYRQHLDGEDLCVVSNTEQNKIDIIKSQGFSVFKYPEDLGE